MYSVKLGKLIQTSCGNFFWRGTVLAVLHLTNRFEKERIERASDIALAQVHSPRYRHLNSILSSKTDQDESKRIQSKAEATKGILKGREYFELFGGESND
jgi:hypothetical protein